MKLYLSQESIEGIGGSPIWCERSQDLSQQKVKTEDGGETFLHGKELKQMTKKRMISKLIPDLVSCPPHLCGILAPEKVVEKEKIK